MIETNGWDTHSGQRARLNAQLRNLDQLVAPLEGRSWRGLGEHVGCRGDRVRPDRHTNGTGGTDHGTGLGSDAPRRWGEGRPGTADWPGLSPPPSTRAAI